MSTKILITCTATIVAAIICATIAIVAAINKPTALDKIVAGTDKNAYKMAARANVQMLESSVECYYLDMDEFPTTAQGFSVLLSAPNDAKNPRAWSGPYLTKPISTDPWGHPYQYLYPGKHKTFDIWSFGPDGIDGTDDDIGNWTSSDINDIK